MECCQVYGIYIDKFSKYYISDDMFVNMLENI